jgi:hypothetical protein
MNSRLATVEPRLSAALASWPKTTRLEIASQVVAWAAERAGLESLQMTVAVGSSPATHFNALAESLDECYFELQEQTNQAHMGYFEKARAATALAFMAMDEPGEALYESIAATDTLSVLAFVSRACSAKGLTFPST